MRRDQEDVMHVITLVMLMMLRLMLKRQNRTSTLIINPQSMCLKKKYKKRSTSFATCSWEQAMPDFGQSNAWVAKCTFAALGRTQSKMPSMLALMFLGFWLLGMTGMPRCTFHFRHTCRTNIACLWLHTQQALVTALTVQEEEEEEKEKEEEEKEGEE